jgi:type I restriction enzyme S subunit
MTNDVLLGDICEFLDHKRKPVTEGLRTSGPYPYYGANGQQGWIDDYLFDEPLVLLAEDGGHFGSATKPISYKIEGKTWVNNHAHVLRPRPGCDIDFLTHVLSFLDVSKFVNGSTRLKLTKGNAEQIRIPLPPLAEQQRLSKLLGEASRLRRMRRYALGMCDELVSAAFIEMFGDPVQNTKDWPPSQLEDLASVERGKFTPRPRNDPSYYGGAFPFIQTGDISDSGGRLRSWTQTLNEKGRQVSRSFPPGTIVIAIVGATIGMTAILEIEVYCPDSVVGIQVDSSQATKEYIEFVLRFWRPTFLAQAPETARANINLDTLRPLRVPVPPLSLQQKFSNLVEQSELLRSTQRESLHQADHLFRTLLHQAFSPR